MVTTPDLRNGLIMMAVCVVVAIVCIVIYCRYLFTMEDISDEYPEEKEKGVQENARTSGIDEDGNPSIVSV